MKRVATLALLFAVLAPLTATSANADVLKATGVMTASKGWTVTLSIPKVTMRTGSSMPATLTIVNKTKHSVSVSGCEVDGIFTVGIGNAKVPYAPINGDVACSTRLHVGSNVFHERIYATYMSCGGGQGSPKCDPSIPNLPVGVYGTVVDWPAGIPFIAKPGSLTIWVTK